MSTRAALISALAVALAFFGVALRGLDEHGPTWDLVLGEYGYGHQFLAYALSGDEAYVDFPGAREPEARAPHPDFSGRRFAVHMVYPFGGLLSAAACELLWSRWGWLDAMAAHHLVVLAFTAALIGTLVYVAGRRLGALAAVGATLAALGGPRLMAHGFYNLKDVPETVLYTWTYLAAVMALERRSRAAWVLTGVLWGLALAQKANALFVPVQALAFLVCVNLARRRAGEPRLAWPWLGAALVAVSAPLAYLAVSPYFWTDTLARLGAHAGFIWNAGTRDVSGASGIAFAVWTTPLTVLILALGGALTLRASSSTRWLLLLGIGVPLGRTLLPLRHHDGIRHYLEFVPFLCLLAGAGFATASGWLASTWGTARARALAALLVGLVAFGPALGATATTYPHGIAYFNALMGGLKGAQDRGLLDATDYWGNSYWAGLAWLDEHAEPGASLAVPVAPHIVAAAAPVRLRNDIRLSVDPTDELTAPLYVMTITRVAAEGHVLYRWVRNRLEPIHRIEVQGAPILEIYRVDDPVQVAQIARLRARWALVSQRLGQWLTEARPDLIYGPGGLRVQLATLGLPGLIDWLDDELPPELDPLLAELRALERESR